jgi:alpha-galactosidase
MEEIAAVPVHPVLARVYAEGWQSWSPVGMQPASAPPPAVTSAQEIVQTCQYQRAAPEGTHRASGLLAVEPGGGAPPVLFGASSVAEQVPVIQAVLRDNQLIVSADGPVVEATDSGPFGMLGALGRWGERFAGKEVPADRRAVPAVWCSWYQYYDRVTAADVSLNLGRIASMGLAAEVVQVDDGWAAAPGDWLTVSPRFGDLHGLARQITDMGRRPGIWIAPWMVGRSSDLLRSHPDWVVRVPESGEPVPAGAGLRDECLALDLTMPAAAEYLAVVMRTLREWGFEYFKIDFCYAGAVEGRRHEDMPGVAAYRQGLNLLRSAIGPEAVLLGCGAPLLPSAGLVDAMRVGPDISVSWDPASGEESSWSAPCQRNASRTVVARAWQHGRLWVNDPDCLMLRPSVERRADWAALVARYGGLRASGDAVDELDEWGLEQTRQLLVPASLESVTPS